MLTATQWTTFSLPITVRQPAIAPATVGIPVDLTGSTAEGALFKGYAAVESYPLSFAFASDRTTGQVTASLTPAQVGAIPYGAYLCQVKITDSVGTVQLLLNQAIVVLPGRPPHV